MTRAMFVTVLEKLSYDDMGSYDKKSHFKDINRKAYYEKYVNWAYEHKILKGISKDDFAPGKNVTKEETAAIVYNYLKMKNIKIEEIKPRYKKWADKNEASLWSKKQIESLLALNLIVLDDEDKFYPKQNAKRHELATIISNVYRIVYKK